MENVAKTKANGAGEASGSGSGFGSVFGFLMTAIGYSVGLGAIWRFPYLMGENGGGAFLLVMLGMFAVIGIPLILSEMILGRVMQTTPIVGFHKLIGKRSKWSIIGWLGAAAATLLMSYYVMITGNVAHYLFLTVIGNFKDAVGADMPIIYGAISSNVGLMLFYNALLLGIGGFVISKGVTGGIEKFAKIALPTLLVCLLICAAKSLTLPAAGEAVKWLFTPDFSKITGELVLASLSQTLFLGGLGMASVYVFGSYLTEKDSLTQSSIVMILSNILVSVLAGLVIFPAVFTYKVDPSSGSSLVFQTMPVLFANMTGGRFFGSLFFLTLLTAAYTTCLGLVEGITATLADEFKVDRKAMVWVVMGLIFIIGLIPVFVMSGDLTATMLGKDLYTMLDFVTMYILIPIGAVLTAVYGVWVFGFKNLMEEGNKGATIFKLSNAWKILMGVVCPLVIIVVLVMGIQGTFF